ncbi:MAG: BMC domain-containing protein [Comamonadaceae bacterium]|nr:BMC domain-containing protein [Comamonadaceae bacterium]
MKHACGFLEVRGLVAGIECADTMLKAASVRLATQITTNPALITLIVEGDIGSCRAAIDAGRLAAERLGAMVSEKVIGRPEPDLALFVNTQQRWKTSAIEPNSDDNDNDNGSRKGTGTGTGDESVQAGQEAPPEIRVTASTIHDTHSAADLGSDPNSANNSQIDAQAAPELGSDPNFADQAHDDLSASPHDIDNADRQPANSAAHPSVSPQIDQDTNPPDPLQALLSYLSPIPNGKRLDQLAAAMKLPEKVLHALLNTALNQGSLKKVGSRYLIP